MPQGFLGLFVVSAFFHLWSCTTRESTKPTVEQDIETYLQVHTLDPWYPRVKDNAFGGFLSQFDYKWEQVGPQYKFTVTQGRHVWTCSRAYEFYPQKTEYLELAKHGFHFLRDKLWDAEYGGFHEILSREGNLLDSVHTDDKRAYGNAFCIYGLAAYYRVSKDKEALDLAKKAFQWFDEHAHDDEYLGYFQFLYRDGTPIPREVIDDYNTRDRAHLGLKDYNSSIHILEAFTELYQVWPDDLVRTRLEEMYHIVLDTMVHPTGYLRLHFFPDWQEVSDADLEAYTGRRSFYANHITFGHDVETAYLLYEAAHVLGIELDEALLGRFKRMVDHSLEQGWDAEYGGFYDAGIYRDGAMEIINDHKSWWGQAEGLNSLLLMHQLYPDDPHNYYQKFLKMWDYIKAYLIDDQHLGWYTSGLDKNPNSKQRNKADLWVVNYHTTRSLVNCIDMLRKGQVEHK